MTMHDFITEYEQLNKTTAAKLEKLRKFCERERPHYLTPENEWAYFEFINYCEPDLQPMMDRMSELFKAAQKEDWFPEYLEYLSSKN